MVIFSCLFETLRSKKETCQEYEINQFFCLIVADDHHDPTHYSSLSYEAIFQASVIIERALVGRANKNASVD